MYEWHFGAKLWLDIGIHYDTVAEVHALIAQTENFVAKLTTIDAAEVERKRDLIRKHAFALQYSLIFKSSVTGLPTVSRAPLRGTV
jgi:hypothetical protein